MTDAERHKDYPKVRILPGQHKRAQSGYPWIYSNEIDMSPETKSLKRGEVVKFEEPSGKILGTGFFNSHSLIAGRIVSREAQRLNLSLIRARIERALKLRERVFKLPYYRLVHAEADGLPGLIVDRYGEIIVIEANAAGAERVMDEVVATLQTLLQPNSILVKGDGIARKLEGLEPNIQWIGDVPSGPIKIEEGGIQFFAEPGTGQKTGWYFDQSANRKLVGKYAKDNKVLDLYCYVGGFALQAAAAGAKSVLGIDRSQPALNLAIRSAELNGLANLCEFRQARAFDAMERLSATPEQFDLVISDPPAFIKSRKDLKAGGRGYRKMVRLAATLVAPGGLLFVASCSHHMVVDLFAEQVRRGLRAAGREGRILHSGGAGPDHPVHPHLPESTYLKFQLLQLD